MQMGSESGNEQFDVIVVGAGVGGCIIAARLAQVGVNPRNGEPLKIALLEWGPYHKGDPVRGYGIPGRRASYDGMPYEDRRYWLPWGTPGMVGGAAMHAGLIAHPPTPIDFEHWRAETGVDWTWEKFNLALAELYEMWHPYPEPEEIRSPGQERFRQAALALGYDVTVMGGARLNCPRCGLCLGHLCKYDAKSTPLVTYIPIAERYGVRIISQAQVNQLVIEKKGSRPVVTGVNYRINGESHQARAGKVIVSCGFNGTPRLLYRSGYGPRAKVQGELIVENRNVGANLVSSLSARHIEAIFDEPIVHPDIGVHSVYGVDRVGSRGYNHLIVGENLGFREGSMSWPVDLALHPLAPEFGREFKGYMRKALMHVGSLRVELAKNPLRGEISVDGLPVFQGSQKAVSREYVQKNHPEVIEMLQEGHEIGRKIMNYMKPRKMIGPDEGIGDRFSTNHQLGTCRAGASRENSVVNSDCESHDVDNLFICDASTVPFQGTANPSMPTAAVCSYAWRRIVANHFSRS